METPSECDFCGKEAAELPLHIRTNDKELDFCSWSCIFAHALSHLKEIENHQSAEIEKLKKRVEDLDYLLAQVRGQAGV